MYSICIPIYYNIYEINTITCTMMYKSEMKFTWKIRLITDDMENIGAVSGTQMHVLF